MNEAQSTGLITSATKSDAVSVTISVAGRYDMNSPMIPGQKSIGKKAATVVSVEVVTGQATSAVPSIAASTRALPICMWR